jgi:uncharacterized protein
MLGLSSRNATLAALLVAAPVLAAAQEAPPRYSEVVRSSRYVAVRDGTRLAMHVYRPAVNGRPVAEKLPVIFAFTPYRGRFRDKDGKIVETAQSAELGLKGMTDHGYVVAVADIRGKGASFGRRRGMQDRTEAQDGRDLVEWLAAKPWSSGKVGMTGCSYLGGTTVQTASTAPPHLKAVFAGASDFDKYEFVRAGGITGQFNTRPEDPLSVDLATLPLDEDKDGSLLKAAVAQHAANDPMALLWNTMLHRDSVSRYTQTRFWEEVGPYTYLDTLKRSGIAFYNWATWHDEPAAQVIIAAANLNGRLLMGPGSHCEPPPGVDLGQVQRAFFDKHLKGLDSGIDRTKRYRWWVLDAPEAERWVESDTLPGVGVTRTALYAVGGKSGTVRSANDGMLGMGAGAAGRDAFTTDYDVASKEYFPFWPAVLDEKGLTYTSPPLAADVTVTGFPIAHVRVSSDQPAGNVFVFLEEVAPDGKAENVAFGRLAIANRKLSKAPYDTLGLPWHSGRQADVLPVKPGEPYDLAIALSPTAKRFRAGHRLRFSIRGADPRQRNIAQIERKPAETMTIERGRNTRVEVPALQPIRFADTK